MESEHYCDKSDSFPLSKFLQLGIGRGQDILIVGEAPAPNGWRKSGKAFYTSEGKLLPTGKILNELLKSYAISVEISSFTELVKCYVGTNRAELLSCGQKCWPIFARQLKLLHPKLILLLGIKSLEIFNRQTNLKLKVGEISEFILDEKTYIILPIYHPSPIGPLNKKRNQEIFSNLNHNINTILNS